MYLLMLYFQTSKEELEDLVEACKDLADDEERQEEHALERICRELAKFLVSNVFVYIFAHLIFQASA